MRFKRFLAFVVAFAMVMSITPAMGIFASANEAVALFDGVEYSSLSEAVAAASEAFIDKKVEVELLMDSSEDFTLNGGIVYLTTGGYAYTGVATVTDALLIADKALASVVCDSTATDADNTRYGYSSLATGLDMVEGAQVRIGDGASDDGKVAGKNSGLRFIATVDQNDTLATYAYTYYDSVNEAYADGYEIGMEIIAEDSASSVDVPATLWQEEGAVFTAALTDLAEGNYNRRYTANAYIEYDGLRFESEASSTRSIYQVASGLLSKGETAEKMSESLVNVLNAYVNQTGVRLTLTDSSDSAALKVRGEDKKGGYTGDAFFTVGDTVYRNGAYEVDLTAVGKSVINTKLFNEYVRINNNNSLVKAVTGITDNGNGSYTVIFDYADLSGGTRAINEAITLTNGSVTAYVPEGVQFTGSAKNLELVLTAIDDEKSEVEAGEGEELNSFDIHVNGLAEGNITPVIITLHEMAQKGLNRGNLALYHVEDGVQVKMEQVDTASDLTKHNQFTYNPLDGTITLALASFSEVALVSEEAKWEGNYASGFAGGTGTEADPYLIANADQLAYFSAAVGGMGTDKEKNSFNGEFVKLVNDIDLDDMSEDGKIFYPIGYYNSTGSYEKVSGGSITSSVSSFEGTFDGNGHTIKNFYQNTWEMFGDYNSGYSGTPNHYKDAMGLFGCVVNGTVKNLTVENFSSDGEFTPTGVIAAYAVNSTFENIAITNCNPRVYNTGNGGIVGIGGNSDDPDEYKLTFTNITIDNTNKITALWGSWDVACGGLVGMFRGAGHAYMTNCHVAAQIDVYNDVCGNYQYYWYRYAGMMIGTNKNMTEDENGYTVPETDKFHAESCTVHFGEWNDYYYFELVANSIASYTHDHQFSRLTQVASLDEIKDGDAWTKTGNFLLIDGDTKTCYHVVKGTDGNLTEHTHEDAGEETVDGEIVLKEDKQIVYLPFNQLFTGYGWGVKHIPLGEFDGVTILDREEADSVVKFSITGKANVEKDSTVKIGELFEAVKDAEVAIDADNVQVTVSPANDESTVSAVYTANTTDWTQGTLEFTGYGKATITITDYYFCKPTTIDCNIVVTIDGTEYCVMSENLYNNSNFSDNSGEGMGQWYVGSNTNGNPTDATYQVPKINNDGTVEALTLLTDTDYLTTGAFEQDAADTFYYGKDSSKTYLVEHMSSNWRNCAWNGKHSLLSYVPIKENTNYTFSFKAFTSSGKASIRYGAIDMDEGENFYVPSSYSTSGSLNFVSSDYFDCKNNDQQTIGGAWTTYTLNFNSGEGADYFLFNAYWLQVASYLCITDFMLYESKEPVSVNIDYVDSEGNIIATEENISAFEGEVFNFAKTGVYLDSKIIAPIESSYTVTADEIEAGTINITAEVTSEYAAIADTYAATDGKAHDNDTTYFVFAGCSDKSVELYAPHKDTDGNATVTGTGFTLGSQRVALISFKKPSVADGQTVTLNIGIAGANGNIGNASMRVAVMGVDGLIDENTGYLNTDYPYDAEELVWSNEWYSGTGKDAMTFDVTEIVKNMEDDYITFAFYVPLSGIYIIDTENAVRGGLYQGEAAYLTINEVTAE